MTDGVRETHVDPAEVAGYLAGTLAPEARARVESHLADCEDCAAELVAVDRLRRAPAGVRWAPWLGLAAAAAIAAVVLAPRADRERGPAVPPVRGDSLPSATLSLVGPADGAELREPPVLVWRPVAGAATYRVVLSRSDGDSVWSATTGDTTATPPGESLLPSPEPYYWYVDALLADGRSVGGTPHSFRLGP
jgi:anti-sigma factor RsiW